MKLLLRFTAILLAVHLFGCAAYDKKVDSYTAADIFPDKLAGTYVNHPTYVSNSAGLVGIDDFGNVVGIYNNKADFIELEYEEDSQLRIVLIASGKRIFTHSYKIGEEVEISAEGKFTFPREHGGGIGDGPGIGYYNTKFTLFADANSDLVVVQSGGGAGLLGVIPIVQYAKLMTVFPRLR